MHGLALLGAQRFGEALPHLRAPRWPPSRAYLGHHNTPISGCGHLGLLGEAARFIAARNGVGPPIRIGVLRRNLEGFAHRDVFVEGLEKAGVPE